MKRTSNWQLAIDVASKLALPVFPCREKDSQYQSRGVVHRRNAKAPYTKNGHKDATTSPEAIDQLWAKNPNAMVGVPMGQASGLIAVDIDEGNGKSGEVTFAKLDLKVPKTVQTKTMSGGRHLFFRVSHEIEIRNDTSTVFGQDIDVRGEGGYVIWAGSEGVDGSYSFINGLTPDEAEFADMPEAFLAYFKNKAKERNQARGVEGTRNNDLFLATVKNVHAGMEEEGVEQTARAMNQKFSPPLPIDEVQAVTKSALTYRSNNQYPCTDLGNAERFRRDHQGSVIYVTEMKSWLCYRDGVWEPDQARVSQLMHQTVRSIVNEGGGSIEARDAMLRFSKRSEANARIKAALDIASSLDGIVTPASKLDAKKDLLNMSNGTLNLKNLECREHRAEDLLTYKTSAKFKPGLQASRWYQFIWEVTGGDAANEAYLQKFCGYTLLANRPEQIILFLIGDGGDGKSVFIETIKNVLGDYQATLAASSISSSNKSSIPNDIAKLRGKRLATISELPKDLHVDTQMVKGISGGDTQTARFLHQEYFDFDPHAQLLIATNFYPYANPEDKAYFRRVEIMRFPVCFTDKQPDKHLAQTLRGEADGILTWMIDGLRGYLEEGLYPTPSMLFEKEQYKRFADPLSIFFDEYLEATDERDFVMSGDMDAHFEKFQEIEQRRGITREEMRKFLHRKGYERKQRRIGSDRFRGYVGLNLRIFRDDDMPF